MLCNWGWGTIGEWAWLVLGEGPSKTERELGLGEWESLGDLGLGKSWVAIRVVLIMCYGISPPFSLPPEAHPHVVECPDHYHGLVYEKKE